MASSVEEAFNGFHTRLIPTRRESEAAKRHQRSIRSCLERELALRSFSQCGSFGNGTSIAGFSDTDYIACFPASIAHGDSRKVLRQVNIKLGRRFPHTGVHVTSPAVKVPFGSLPCETTEVVPAKQCGRTQTGRAIYSIPDGYGGWMQTSPHAHNAHVQARNEILHGRLKPLITFVKAWKYFNNVPVSSFYLEMRMARYMSKKSTVDYERDLAGFFEQLSHNLADVRDPVDISGLIKACPTSVKKTETISKLRTAASRSSKALRASQAGKMKEAFFWWQKLFGSTFPSYSDR